MDVLQAAKRLGYEPLLNDALNDAARRCRIAFPVTQSVGGAIEVSLMSSSGYHRLMMLGNKLNLVRGSSWMCPVLPPIGL